MKNAIAYISLKSKQPVYYKKNPQSLYFDSFVLSSTDAKENFTFSFEEVDSTSSFDENGHFLVHFRMKQLDEHLIDFMFFTEEDAKSSSLDSISYDFFDENNHFINVDFFCTDLKINYSDKINSFSYVFDSAQLKDVDCCYSIS
jgi:hypothetical protein